MTDASTGCADPGLETARAKTFYRVMLLWLMGIWWLASQYQGFVRIDDGLLYSLDAMRRLMPESLAGDLFFWGSSQGDFSLFGWIYAELARWIGLKPAGLVMFMVGRVAWGIGCVWLVGGLWRQAHEQARWMSLVLMLLLPTAYDGFGMLTYAGNEVTPRCWAEACILWALVFHGQQRVIGSWLLGALALLLHPLMALPGLGLLWLLQPKWKFVAVLAVVVAVVVGGTWLELGPFKNTLAVFDDAWWHTVVVVVDYALVPTWPLLIWVQAAVCGGLLWVAWRRATDPWIQRLSLSLLVLMVVMLGLAWWASWTRNVLWVQLQPWRVLWLVKLLAPALWVGTLPPWRTWRASMGCHVGLIVAGLLAPAWPWVVGLVAGGATLRWPRIRQVMDSQQRLGGWVIGVSVMLGLMVVGLRYPMYLGDARAYQMNEVIAPVLVAVAHESVWALLLTLALVAGVFRAQTLGALRWCVGLSGVPLLACIYVLAGQVRVATDVSDEAQLLQKVIPPGSVVHWDAGVYSTWFSLNRSEYVSYPQGLTALFSREAAMEFRRRLSTVTEAGILGQGERINGAGLKPLLVPDEIQAVLPLLQQVRLLKSPAMNRTMGPDHLRVLCQDAMLNFVLLTGDIEEADQRVAYGSGGEVISVFKCR